MKGCASASYLIPRTVIAIDQSNVNMWNPDTYDRFKIERQQPFHDLLAMIEPRRNMRIVDLGCGTGEMTRILHDHLQAEETLGIDNSETMLLKTKSFGASMLRFERGDIE